MRKMFTMRMHRKHHHLDSMHHIHHKTHAMCMTRAMFVHHAHRMQQPLELHAMHAHRMHRVMHAHRLGSKEDRDACASRASHASRETTKLLSGERVGGWLCVRYMPEYL